MLDEFYELLIQKFTQFTHFTIAYSECQKTQQTLIHHH